MRRTANKPVLGGPITAESPRQHDLLAAAPRAHIPLMDASVAPERVPPRRTPLMSPPVRDPFAQQPHNVHNFCTRDLQHPVPAGAPQIVFRTPPATALPSKGNGEFPSMRSLREALEAAHAPPPPLDASAPPPQNRGPPHREPMHGLTVPQGPAGAPRPALGEFGNVWRHGAHPLHSPPTPAAAYVPDPHHSPLAPDVPDLRPSPPAPAHDYLGYGSPFLAARNPVGDGRNAPNPYYPPLGSQHDPLVRGAHPSHDPRRLPLDARHGRIGHGVNHALDPRRSPPAAVHGHHRVPSPRGSPHTAAHDFAVHGRHPAPPPRVLPPAAHVDPFGRDQHPPLPRLSPAAALHAAHGYGVHPPPRSTPPPGEAPIRAVGDFTIPSHALGVPPSNLPSELQPAPPVRHDPFAFLYEESNESDDKDIDFRQFLDPKKFEHLEEFFDDIDDPYYDEIFPNRVKHLPDTAQHAPANLPLPTGSLEPFDARYLAHVPSGQFVPIGDVGLAHSGELP